MILDNDREMVSEKQSYVMKIRTKALALSIAFGTESSPVEHAGLSHHRLQQEIKLQFYLHHNVYKIMNHTGLNTL